MGSNANEQTSMVAYSEDGGKTWKRLELPISQLWNPTVYADGVVCVFPCRNIESSSAAFIRIRLSLAPLPGQEDVSAALPAPPLENQIIALRMENAALAAAVERGLSL